jgi:hypothetical protein
MSIKEILDSREVGQDRVGKPYSWDSVELETRVIVQVGLK